jgi:hypothetical protein
LIATRNRTTALASVGKSSINVTLVVIYPVSKCDASSLP